MSPQPAIRAARTTQVDPHRIDLRRHWDDLSVGYVRAAWSALPEHQHSTAQVIVPFCGTAAPIPLRAAWRSSNGRAFGRALGRGDSCIFLPDQPHTLSWDGDVEQLSFYFSPDFLTHAAHDLTPSARADLVPRQITQDPFIRHLGAALRASFVAEDGPARLHIEAPITVLAVHLLRIGGAGGRALQPVLMGLDPRRLRWVTEYIDAHLAHDLALATLATTAGLSPYHFARAFKAATGLPPHRYVVVRRLARAQELLRDSDMAIGEIATRVGFRTQSHLTALFREHLATTPRAYRHARR